MTALAPGNLPRVATSESSPDAALSLTQIHRSWGANHVLRGIDLVLARGARGFLGGRNGAGKTTLLRIAAGLLEPDAGTVRLAGLDPHRDRRDYQRRLGYLPAGNGGLYARLSVRQNLELWARLALLPRSQREEALARGIHHFDLAELEHSRVDRISMGQRQRVRLAMSLLHDPEVVLLDEAHTSLDDEALDLLGRALGERHERGGAALWCAPTQTDAPLEFDVAFAIEDGVAVAL